MAYTKPELVKRWLGVHAGWSLAACEIDLRVGGAYRFVWRGPDGAEMGMGGVYREVVVPERIVATEKFDQSWYPGEAVSTIAMVEQGGRTTLTLTVRYESREARDAVLKSPMEQGVAAGLRHAREAAGVGPGSEDQMKISIWLGGVLHRGRYAGRSRRWTICGRSFPKAETNSDAAGLEQAYDRG